MNQLTIAFTFILGLCASLLFWIMNTMFRVPLGASPLAAGILRSGEEPFAKPGGESTPRTFPVMRPNGEKAADRPEDEIQYSSFNGTWAPTPFAELGREKSDEIKRISKEFMDLRTWLKLNDVLRSAHADPADIAKRISGIPALRRKILQTINSSYFGLPNKIESVERAITLLGYDRLKAIILDSGLHATIGKEEQIVSTSFNRQWAHATAVATCSQHLAARLLPETRHDFYALALLHDIGRYFLPLIKDSGRMYPGQHPVIQEELRYGINHAQLGGRIITHWHLPEFIARTVEYHHYPQLCSPGKLPPEFLTPAFILSLADIIAKVLEYPGLRREAYPVRPEYFQYHDMDPDVGKLITPALVKRIDKNCRTLNYQHAA